MHDSLRDDKALAKWEVLRCRDRGNSGVGRWLDLFDRYMCPGVLCRRRDNLGAVLATPEQVKASSRDFPTALTVVYAAQRHLTTAVPVMARALITLFKARCQLPGTGKLVGLMVTQHAKVIAIAAAYNVSLPDAHSESVSPWKGFSPGLTSSRAVYAASPAKRAFTGPTRLFEGPNGLERMFAQTDAVDWHPAALEVVKQVAVSPVPVTSSMAVTRSYPQSVIIPRAFEQVRGSSQR